MAVTYYEYSVNFTSGFEIATGNYTNRTSPEYTITVNQVVSVYYSFSGIPSYGVANISGSAGAIAHWEANNTAGANNRWDNVGDTGYLSNVANRIVLTEATSEGSPFAGVTYEIDESSSGLSWPNQYWMSHSMLDGEVLVPTGPGGESFDPSSFPYDEAQGLGVHVEFATTSGP